MERPWVYAIVGGAALFVVVIGVKNFSGSAPDELAEPQAAPMARLPERGRGETSGWIARPGAPGSADGSADSGGRAAPFGRSGSAPGRGDFRSGGSGSGASEGRGGASVFVGNSRSAGGGTGLGTIPSQAGGAGGSIQVESGVPVADIPFEGARPQSGGPISGRADPGSSAETVVDPTDPQDSKKTEPDENGRVLSLPFDKSTEPERGETAVFEQGVTYESGEGVFFPTDSQFVVPNGGNLDGEAGSVSLWVQPEWAGGDETNASLVQLRNQNQWEDRLQIFKNGRYMRFLLTDSAGQEHNIGATIDDWAPGDWHHVAGTWERNAEGQMMQSFYVDGRMIGQVPVQGPFNVRPGTPLYIGSDLPQGVPGANGALSQFQAYNRALTPGEVANQASSRR